MRFGSGFIGHDAEATAHQERVDRGLDDVSDLFTRDLVDAIDQRDMSHQQAIGFVAGEVQRDAVGSRRSIQTRATAGGSPSWSRHDLARVDAAKSRKMDADLQARPSSSPRAASSPPSSLCRDQLDLDVTRRHARPRCLLRRAVPPIVINAHTKTAISEARRAAFSPFRRGSSWGEP